MLMALDLKIQIFVYFIVSGCFSFCRGVCVSVGVRAFSELFDILTPEAGEYRNLQ